MLPEQYFVSAFIVFVGWSLACVVFGAKLQRGEIMLNERKQKVLVALLSLLCIVLGVVLVTLNGLGWAW